MKREWKDAEKETKVRKGPHVISMLSWLVVVHIKWQKDSTETSTISHANRCHKRGVCIIPFFISLYKISAHIKLNIDIEMVKHNELKHKSLFILKKQKHVFQIGF